MFVYTSVLVYGTSKLLSRDSLVTVIGADGIECHYSRNMNLMLHNLKEQA